MSTTIWRPDTWRYIVGPQRPPSVALFSAASASRQAIAPNNASVIYPVPDVWGTLSSTHARCTMAGNSLLFGVTVAANEAVDVSFDTSRLNGLTSGTTPMIAAYEDGVLLDLNSDGLNRVQLTNAANSQTVTIKASPTNGRHVYRLMIRSLEQRSGQMLGMWGSGGSIPPAAIDITSFGIGPTSALAALVAGVDYYADTMLVVGDSRASGVLANIVDPDTTSTTTAANNNALFSWPKIIADALRCEPGFIAHGGIGYQVQNGTYQGAATANPPMYGASGAGTGEMFLTSNWNGNARIFLQTHKYGLIQLGANDGGSATPTMISGLITAFRSALGPTTLIGQIIDPAGAEAADIRTALATPESSRTRLIDKTPIIDGTTPNVYSPDGSHLNTGGQQRWAADILAAIQSLIGRPHYVPPAYLMPMLAR